jgi:hypothetical protein
MSARLTRRDALASLSALAAGGLLLDRLAEPSHAACCYFAAKDKDVNQPAQKAFINWEPDRQREAFTVQPKFEGNAEDFGMVIPTPAQPKLDEMPRDFFKMLAIFTILEPMPLDKYKSFPRLAFSNARGGIAEKKGKSVVVLEEGVVGSLDYKIIKAGNAKDLYDWLDEHKYSYSGDEKTLDHYIRKEWFFTVMKIDPKQMKRRADGTFEGNVTPTRFTFASSGLIYPLRITQISVKEFTEALFYVQAPEKMDLQDSFSYQFTWQPMWSQAMDWAIKKTPAEEAWLKHIQPQVPKYQQLVAQLQKDGVQPASLEWTKKIAKLDLDVIDGTAKYNRDAPAEDVQQLKLLRGHVQQDRVITKFRKVFHKREMQDDLTIVRAVAAGSPDDTAYYEILPTSPP